MATPIINLASLLAKGNNIDLQGAVDFQGDTGTVQFYLDPQPSGTPLGPFDLTVAGINIVKKLKLGAGKWKVRVVATPTSGSPTTVSSPEMTINRCRCVATLPLPDGNPAPVPSPRDKADFDSDFHQLYTTTVKAAAANQKRLAAANALVTAFGDKQTLQIFSNGKMVARCEYVGPMTYTTDNGEYHLKTSVAQGSQILASANLATTNGTFVFQGGENYSTQIVGTVGLIGSGKTIILSDNPITGVNFSSEFDFLLSSEMETL